MRKPTKFIDALRLYARGGTGGHGLPTYGGIGGKGGNIIVRSTKGISLQKIKQTQPNNRWIAGNGENSQKFRILGKAGADLIIPSPIGTVVTTDNDSILADFDEENKEVVVALGGKGGDKTTKYFGQRGQTLQINLILKLIADIGFVGFPNAGKSTLLKAISRAKPKIASYPFTTITPNIGEINYQDYRKITLADLPGLIEGAWKNYGMGHSFLKHVERTRLILFIIDINGFKLKHNSPYREAIATFLSLNKELELYRPDLTEKPSAIVVNKLDSDVNGKLLNEFLHKFDRLSDELHKYPEEIVPKYLMKPSEIIPCSAKFNRTSVEYLKERLRLILDEHDNDEKRLLLEEEAKLSIEDKLVEKNVRLK